MAQGRFYFLREANKTWTVRDHRGVVFYTCKGKREAEQVASRLNIADRS